jgi:hypothetical protein
MLKQFGKVGAVALALAVGSAANAALITFDLRGPGGAKSVATPASAGQTVQLNLYAIVTNGNGNQADDGFLLAHGSILSADSGTQLGDLSALQLNTPFLDNSVSSGGTPTNLDGNPDLELGGTNPSSSTGYIIASTGTSAKFSTGTTGNAEFLLGTVVWTYTGGEGTTELQFSPRNRTDGAVPGKQLVKGTSDGVNFLLTGADVNNIAFGAPVTIGVPEPTTLGLAAIGLTGLLARRRK